MLDQVSAFFSLKKEIPDAVGYDTYGPVVFPLPKEVLDLLSGTVIQALDSVAVFGVHVDNYSIKIQKDVRVLYSGDFEYAPKVAFRRREVEVKYKVNKEDKQIEIFEIPPDESVDIEFFNPNDGFLIERVIIGDSQVTPLMQKLAEAKKYPLRTRMEFLLYFFLVLAFLFSGFSCFYVWRNVEEAKQLNSLLPESQGCHPYVYDNSIGNEPKLVRKILQYQPLWREFVFSLNKVVSLDELKLKDKVVLCDPKIDVE
ncbi:hypothetical protein [Pseudomonas capsici]|uniref:hypothetical protein n=1 Tax=Pseudomonas capsici TaxID=2810614 RepID=UPI0021F0A794|nr:hypothetical protein [Pseudomonas capsici]